MLMSRYSLNVSCTTGGTDTLLKFSTGQRWLNLTPKHKLSSDSTTLQILKNSMNKWKCCCSAVRPRRPQIYLLSSIKPSSVPICVSYSIEVKVPTWTHTKTLFLGCYHSIFCQSVTSVALRNSPQFLNLLILTYQSHTYSSSAAAEWNRSQKYL